MKVLLFIQIIFTSCSAQLSSLLDDCSHYQPFDVVRDDGSKTALVENISINDTSNDQSMVNFYLYNRGNPVYPIEIVIEDVKSIEKAQYDKNLPLAVIVHGWLGNSKIGSAKAILNSFFHPNYNKNLNLIVIDWSGAASDATYISAPAKVPYVGQKLSQFLNWLLKNTGSSWEKIHLIGYDLGAHVVGHAGRSTDGKVGRITGLDPISPCFKETSSSLEKSDGEYVEVIHTDCAYIRSLGIILPIGHVDFYPNNCKEQPGCEDYVCSHARSYELFAASVVFNNLKGIKCNDIWDALKAKCNNTHTLNMGNDDYNKRGEGIYSLITASEWPFDLAEVSPPWETTTSSNDLQLDENNDYEELSNTEAISKKHENKNKQTQYLSHEDMISGDTSKSEFLKTAIRDQPTIGIDLWGHG